MRSPASPVVVTINRRRIGIALASDACPVRRDDALAPIGVSYLRISERADVQSYFFSRLTIPMPAISNGQSPFSSVA
jgi:hypothetical protein